MKEENEELKIDIYKSENSEEFEKVDGDTLLDLVKKNKVTYEVYKKRWFYVTAIVILIIYIIY
jgi:hypothetical protein